MMPAVANAPAATAIQTRSKTIQSPHAYVSDRWVRAAEAEREPRDERERAERHDRREQQVRRSPELPPDRGELACVVRLVPPSAFATSSLRFPRA